MIVPSGRIHNQYTKYLLSVCIGNVISGVTSTLSTHGMLGTFIKDDESNVNLYSVSLNLILKDIIGQTLSFPVIRKMSKICDVDQQKHLKLSLLLYETSNFLECSTPLFDSYYFIYIASLGNIGKNIGFTSYGAFNAKFINIMSLDKDNISEIYSSVASISSISFSFGMCLGLIIVKLIPDHNTRLFILPFLGLIRYYSIYYLTKDIK